MENYRCTNYEKLGFYMDNHLALNANIHVHIIKIGEVEKGAGHNAIGSMPP